MPTQIKVCTCSIKFEQDCTLIIPNFQFFKSFQLPPSSSYGVNLMLPHIHQCLADVNKIKLTQASIQTDLDTYNQRSHDLERKVFDLQHQVDQLNEERTYLRDQLKQVALKHTALKKNVKKRHQQVCPFLSYTSSTFIFSVYLILFLAKVRSPFTDNMLKNPVQRLDSIFTAYLHTFIHIIQDMSQ